jgi:hypothetical protein
MPEDPEDKVMPDQFREMICFLAPALLRYISSSINALAAAGGTCGSL